MAGLLDTIIQGILLGGLYALFAAGLSLIFGVMRLVNLAHGDLIVIAAYLILVLAESPRLSIFVAILLVSALQISFLNRVLGAAILPPLLVTFGLSIILQNGALAVFSADSRRLPAFGLDSASLPIGPFAIGVLPLLTLVAAVATIF